MEFISQGAYSINFVFDKFYLADNSQLYIVNSDGTMLYGPVTSEHNTKNGYFLTDLIQGDDVTIYLFEPNSSRGKSQLTIKRAIHAYKNLYLNKSNGNMGGSGSCNNNIDCFPAWDLESDAVALVLLSDGSELCSGSLIITADKSFRSYFLSAFHCVDISPSNSILAAAEITNAENWMFKYQYKMSECNGSTATTGITYNGATFRAAWNTSDFVLMEMDNSPIGNTQFSWLGWDRSGNIPTSGTGIHHPSGDVMKISLDNNSLIETNYLLSTGNGHWMVNWDDGVTEGGSSGSALLNETRRLIGQLHGGYSSCSTSDLRDWYGCFNRSWTGGGTNTTRLSNWLDPCGSGAVTTNTSRSPYLSGPTIVCSSGSTFIVNNIPAGSTLTWSLSSNLQVYYGGSDFRAIKAIANGSAWIDVTVNSSCGIFTLPRFNLIAGYPTPTLFVSQHSGEGEPLEVLFRANPYLAGAANTYHWYVNNTLEESNLDYNEFIRYVPCNQTLNVKSKLSNSCGTSGFSNTAVVSGDCSSPKSLTINPNPVAETMVVSISSTSESDTTNAKLLLTSINTTEKESVLYAVSLTDFMGTVVFSTTFIDAYFTIPVSKIDNGNYILTVTEGSNKYQKTVVIKH